MLMQEAFPLERHFGPEVGRWVQKRLEEHGVELHGRDELDRFEGSDGRVTKVLSKGGVELDAQCVVMGTGVAADVMLARGAGLEIGDGGGVRCSALLETSVPGIYAAGDVAEFDSPLHGRPARVEHFEVAVAHGKTAALNMLGRGQEHDEVPYFWSDLGDWATLEYVGVGPGEAVTRGSLDDGDFSVFYLDDGRVVGALTLGRSDDLDHARRMISARATPSPEALADEATDLSSL
jgi:3-phenylpropionate/trans-cinnamate dioxygenase ferredoxin reductase subunit